MGDNVDKIVAVMGHMVDHSFSHVPILEDGRVAGVFCEWTPLEIARDTGELLIDASAPLSSLGPWLAPSRPRLPHR